MKNSKYEDAYKLYQQGYSLADVGKVIGVTRQSVYDCFKRRGYKMRSKKFLPFVLYNDLKWTINCSGYYRCTTRKNKEQLLQDIKKSNFSATGRKYGVTCNAIRKWLK